MLLAVGGVCRASHNTSSGIEGWWNCLSLYVWSRVCVWSPVSLCMLLAVGGVCRASHNTSSGIEGWWNGRSASLTSLSQCHSSDQPSGLHFIRYRSPANFSLPDEVSSLVQLPLLLPLLPPSWLSEKNMQSHVYIFCT